MLILKAVEKFGLNDHPQARLKFYEYMLQSRAKYPTLYTQDRIDKYDPSNPQPELTVGCLNYSHVEEGPDPCYGAINRYMHKHPLIEAIKSSIIDDSISIYASFSVEESEEIGQRYENEFRAFKVLTYTIQFRNQSAFAQWFRGTSVVPNWRKAKAISDYFQYVLGLSKQDALPTEIVQYVQKRKDYLSQPDNWSIQPDRLAISYGEQLFTGDSRISSRTMVKWKSLDGIAEGTEDAFWSVEMVQHQSPWIRAALINVWPGITVDEFLTSLGFHNVYHNINFDIAFEQGALP